MFPPSSSLLPALLLFLGLSARPAASQTEFADNGYSNVIVSISPDVSADQANDIIAGIQTWISSGSQRLYTATKQMAYVKQVRILIPESWTDVEAETSTDVATEDGVIQVKAPNPLYGDIPYTVQNGGCGERGDLIHVTPTYLANVDTLAAKFGPPGSLFVHEWSKLRYGVFEEYGFPGDPVYPLFYLESDYTSDGYVEVVTPNFCTNQDIQGHSEDILTGEDCTYSEETGLPTDTCIFFPDGDNSGIVTSYMAAPFLTTVEHYCEDDVEEFLHRDYLPTKHNDLCKFQSTWAIVSANEDFEGVTALGDETAPDTEYIILRPTNGDFVMVLDRSGSMGDNDRMVRLKQSAVSWIQLDVQDGSWLGITSFSSDTRIDADMTEIVDQATRDELSDAIYALNPDGGTCLGEGVYAGLDLLATRSSSGGIMIFITDGEFECDGGTDLNDPDLLATVEESGVRIITIAFSDNADEDLENLAQVSDGKTYFIPDGQGVEDIDSALDGALTYQPAVPTEELDIVISATNEEGLDSTSDDILGSFIIDATLGRDVKMSVAYGQARDVTNIRLFDAAGGSIGDFVSSTDASLQVYTAEFGDLDTGTYQYALETDGELDFADITITSKAKADTLPIETRCWINVDNEEVDLEDQYLAVLAEVTQGGQPVIHAEVEALIEKEGSARIEQSLLDDGSDADITADDGIYSRYFARFDDDGRYTVRCQVVGTDDTEINGGFVVTKNLLLDPETGKAYPLVPDSTTPICCGSTALNSNSQLTPTGAFTRQATIGSVKIANAPGADADLFPPDRITDLTAEFQLSTQQILMTFTSPGDDFSEGTPASYEIRFAPTQDMLIDDFSSQDLLTDNLLSVDSPDDLSPVAAGQTKSLSVDAVAAASDFDWAMESVMYAAALAVDDVGAAGSISAIVSFNVGDVIGPAAIGDLVTSSVVNEYVVVSFTEVGDDGTDGVVDHYEIRFARTQDMLTDDFANQDLLTDQQLSRLSPSDLEPVGAGETKTLYVDTLAATQAFGWSQDSYRFVAAVAYDNVGQVSSLSEVVQFIVGDVLAPAEITDLAADVEGAFSSLVNITFTEVGDDGDTGTVSRYELRYTGNATVFDEENFDAAELILGDMIDEGSLDPEGPGNVLSVVIDGEVNLAGRSATTYLAVAAFDNKDNAGPAMWASVFVPAEDSASTSGASFAFLLSSALLARIVV